MLFFSYFKNYYYPIVTNKRLIYCVKNENKQLITSPRSRGFVIRATSVTHGLQIRASEIYYLYGCPRERNLLFIRLRIFSPYNIP